MKTSSAKAKGRRAQDEVCIDLRERVYVPLGCERDDVKPVTMGVSGLDILLSPAAKKILDVAMEVKNVEALNVTTTFIKHHTNYHETHELPILAHRRNRTPMLATLLWEDLVDLLSEVTRARRRTS